MEEWTKIYQHHHQENAALDVDVILIAAVQKRRADDVHDSCYVKRTADSICYEKQNCHGASKLGAQRTTNHVIGATASHLSIGTE